MFFIGGKHITFVFCKKTQKPKFCNFANSPNGEVPFFGVLTYPKNPDPSLE